MFRRKMVVQGAGGDPGSGHDVPHARCVVAVLLKNVCRGVQEPRPQPFRIVATSTACSHLHARKLTGTHVKLLEETTLYCAPRKYAPDDPVSRRDAFSSLRFIWLLAGRSS